MTQQQREEIENYLEETEEWIANSKYKEQEEEETND